MPPYEAKPVSITIDQTVKVSGLWQKALSAKACFVLAHGAGAGMTHPFMTAIADGLTKRHIATLRYQFPYMERGSKRSAKACARRRAWGRHRGISFAA